MYYERRALVDRRQENLPVSLDRRDGKERRAGNDRRKGDDRRVTIRSECADRRAYI